MGYIAAQNRTSQILLVVFFLSFSFVFGTITAIFGGAIALLLIAPILPMIFIFRDFRVGVVILMVILPFQHTPFLPSFSGFNVVNYLTAATFLSLLLSYYFKRMLVAPFPKIFWWAYLLPILAAGLHGLSHVNEVPQTWLDLIGTAYGSPKSYFSGLVVRPLFIVLVSWMLGTSIVNSKQPQRFILPLFIATLLPAVAIIVFVSFNGFDLNFLSSSRSRTVLGALGLHANEFGFLLGTGFTLFLFIFAALNNSLTRFVTILCLGLVSISLALTFSRAGYLIALIGIVAFAFMQKKMRLSNLIWAILILSIALGFAPEAIWVRLSAGLNDYSSNAALGMAPDELTAGRLWLWLKLIPEFWKSPLFGSGLGSTAWSDSVKQGLFFVNHPHNLYLRVLLDTGLIGLLFFAAFARFLLRSMKQVACDDATPPLIAAIARGARVAFLAVLIAGWTNGNYVSESELSILWMAFGMTLPFISVHTNTNQGASKSIVAGTSGQHKLVA